MGLVVGLVVGPVTTSAPRWPVVPPARLVVLGIDAASPALLDAWIADGTLPNLAALAARGVSGHTRGVEGFFIGSTWPSLYTGTNPAKHGVHYLLELLPGTYTLRHGAGGEFVRRPPFWRALADAGQRVAILDVPLTRLEPPPDGIQVVEWGGHDSLFGFRASSDALAAELVGRYGAHPVGGSCDGDRRTAADFASFVDRLDEGARRKGEWTRDLLGRGGWDLFMQVFTEAHCAGHQCWHLHDATHPAHDAGVAAAVGDPLRRVYHSIDRAIGEVVAAAGDATIVVFSAHGMSHWYGAQFLLHDILVRLGAVVPAPAASPAPRSPLAAAARAGVRAAWRRLPEVVRTSVRRLRAQGRPTPAPPPAIAADVTRSRCFIHPNGLAVGGIRLNLAGREPGGVLAPGAEADAFVAWLEKALLEVTDEATGAPLVRRVVRTATLYEGENLHLLPDLLVEWSDETPRGSASVAGGVGASVRASSPLIGVVEGVNHFGRTGEHRPGGWLVAAGPGIATGRLAHEPSLLDLAPTFAAMLGASLEGCDGRPIDALTAASRAGSPSDRGSGSR